ncbi:lipase family protein [Erwinia psidii]|uniref:Lipase family protein n=1 Tax=Erwinia psidii TaxID=69224 RepID=A0A3N6RWX0_9GAMM|nr:lipase family protein [Erwinia psidii]MCX8961708.1 lipase family protein [Erwinia psidii]RQM37578.1 lipase family protein [Erwinia psidii]
MTTAVSSLCRKNPHAPCDEQMPYWVEFQLVDEQGDPVANMPWTVESAHPDSGPVDNFTHSGQSDANGLIRIDMPHGLELRLTLDGNQLTKEMEKRSLRVGRDAIKNSIVRPRAEGNGYVWHYAVVGELCHEKPDLQLRDGEVLPLFHFPMSSSFQGVKVRTNELEKRHVIEICPFRAWELVLHHQNDYSMANAINLGLASDLAYDDIDTITKYFINKFKDLSTIPSRKIGQSTINALVVDVPYADRYFLPIDIDSTKADDPEGDTQLYYVYNNNKVVIAWRGTASLTDGITDASFRPVESDSCSIKSECTSLVPVGKVHTGFWEGYTLIERKFEKQLTELTRKIPGKDLFICGHSLGGALALIHSARLKNRNPLLYTYGMPRTFTKNAVDALSSIIHYRHVNDQDPVPAVPPEADLDNQLYKLWGPLGTTLGFLWSVVELTAWQVVEWGDCFWHHGKTVAFLTTTQSRKWQQCSIELPYPRNCMTIQARLPEKAKLYLVPSLALQEAKQSGQDQKDFKATLTKEDLKEFFPEGMNPNRGIPANVGNHLLTSYMPYINNKLLGLAYEKELSDGKTFTEHAEKVASFELQMDHYSGEIPKNEFDRNKKFLSLEDLLKNSLNSTISAVSGSDAVKRFGHYGEEDIENV